MIADQLTSSVAEVLRTNYCPTNRTQFITSLAGLAAIFCAVAIVLIARGKTARVAGILIVLFALGAAALDLFGFSGCSFRFEPGLTWDWPW
ncbi:MAG TPA: hypothetical protein VFE36_14125 [Candidatus Baltobacteraceae bacterium]|nr:hypothetical protein [Candidatus Baltobacteraceae bacterium]